MGNYKIVVKVDIVECNEPEVSEFGKRKDGSFEMKISEGDAISIDRCEKALLKTNYEARGNYRGQTLKVEFTNKFYFQGLTPYHHSLKIFFSNAGFGISYNGSSIKEVFAKQKFG